MELLQKSKGAKERNYSIDLLKVIGLSFVILCHVDPPSMIYNVQVGKK